jgi:hypothetical protein
MLAAIAALWTPAFSAAAAAGFAHPPGSEDVDVRALIERAHIERGAELTGVAAGDAVLLLDHTEIKLHADGRTGERRHLVLRLPAGRPPENGCLPRIAWDEERQKLAVHAFRAFRPDGTLIERDGGLDQKRDLRRFTPGALEDCPDYAGRMEAAVAIPEVLSGCIVDLDFSVDDRVSRGGWLSGVEVLQGTVAAMTRVFTLRFPAGSTAEWSVLNGAPSCEEAAGEERILRWTMSNVPGVFPETDGAGKEDFLPAVAFSVNLGETRDRMTWYRSLERELDAAAVPTGKLAEKAAALCDGLLGVDDRFERMHAFVRSAVQPVNYAPLLQGRSARPAERILESGYASQKDHVVLLWALCRSLRIDSWPVLVSDCDVSGDLGVEGAMKGVLLAVILDSGRWLVDPSAPLDRDLALDLPESRIFKPPGADRPFNILPCRLIANAAVTVNEDLTARGRITVRHYGPGSPYPGLSRGIAERDAVFADVASAFLPEGRIASHIIHELMRDQTSYTLEVRAPALPEESGAASLRLIRAADLVKRVLPHVLFRLPEARRSPVYVHHPVSAGGRVTVTLAEGLKLAGVPETVEMINDLGSCSLRWSAEGRVAVLDFMLDLGRGVIHPEDYSSLRRIMVQAVDGKAHTIAIERTGSEDREE